MPIDKWRLFEIAIAILGLIIAGYGAANPLDRIIIIALGIFIILISVVLYFSGELSKYKDKIKELQKRLDYKEELHNIDKRVAILETKMNKKGSGQDWVTLVSMAALAIILYALYVMVRSGQIK